MKKIILIILSILAINFNCVGQTNTVSLDTLSSRLEKLEHDFSFLRLQYTLDETINGLKNLSQDINMDTNELSIYILENIFNQRLYYSHLGLYDSYKKLYTTTKVKIESIKIYWSTYLLTNNLSPTEYSLIEASFEVIEKSNDAVNIGLNSYEEHINFYKEHI